MKLYGKWFTPDINFALGKAAGISRDTHTGKDLLASRQPQPQLVAFAGPVPLSRDGARKPEIGSVIAWSQLLSLLAYETKRQAVLPLFECAGVLDPKSRYAWVVSKPTSASGGRNQPRQVACAYRVGQGCFANLGYPEDIARTPAAGRLTVRLTHEVLRAEGVAGVLRQLRAGLAARGGAPAALLVDVESIATLASAELVRQKLAAFFSSTAPTVAAERGEPTAPEVEGGTGGGGHGRRRLQELKVIRRWQREAARNSSVSQLAAEHSASALTAGMRYLRLASRGTGGSRGGGSRGGRGGAKGSGLRRANLRGYAPGPYAIQLGGWGGLLRRHTCGDGMMTAPSRPPYVC